MANIIFYGTICDVIDEVSKFSELNLHIFSSFLNHLSSLSVNLVRTEEE